MFVLLLMLRVVEHLNVLIYFSIQSYPSLCLSFGCSVLIYLESWAFTYFKLYVTTAPRYAEKIENNISIVAASSLY